MKTTALITLLLTFSLVLGACTIQPAVPSADSTEAAAPATDTGAAPAVDDTATVTETDASEATTTSSATNAVTDTETVTDAGTVVTTTTSVLTTTVTTVTEGAVVSETAVTTGTEAEAGDDADALPTPTAAAPVTTTGAVTTPATVTGTAATTATTVVTDANAGTILQVISSTPGLESLATALTASGMATGLDEPGPLTFFAPNNDAFAAIPTDQFEALLADPTTLAPILQYHIVIDNVSATGLGTLGAALSSSGLPITVTVQADGTLLINDAGLVQADIAASNGVIHVINGVLLPPAPTTP